jgi:hypothetical protein
MLQTTEILSDLAAIPEVLEETVQQTLETLIIVKNTVIDVTTVATMNGVSTEIAMTGPIIFAAIPFLDQILASPQTCAQSMQLLQLSLRFLQNGQSVQEVLMDAQVPQIQGESTTILGGPLSSLIRDLEMLVEMQTDQTDFQTASMLLEIVNLFGHLHHSLHQKSLSSDRLLHTFGGIPIRKPSLSKPLRQFPLSNPLKCLRLHRAHIL